VGLRLGWRSRWRGRLAALSDRDGGSDSRSRVADVCRAGSQLIQRPSWVAQRTVVGRGGHDSANNRSSDNDKLETEHSGRGRAVQRLLGS
jgi:hypothetical protein